jgi:hypothetical protein
VPLHAGEEAKSLTIPTTGLQGIIVVTSAAIEALRKIGKVRQR